MARRLRVDEREEHEPVLRPATIAPTVEPEDEEEPAGRAAAALGNRGFSVLAREGEGILPDGRAHPDVEAAIAASRGRGRSLDPGVHARVAPALGDGLEDVRVHDGPEAAGLARAVDARAFTVGGDVFFGEGEHRPGTAEGDGLIAHELAHVVQQRGASTAGPLRVSQPGDPSEREAGAAASHALQRAPKRAKTQTITFGEGETDVIEGRRRTLDPSSRGSAEQEILNRINEIRSRLVMTEKNILTALDQFSDDQAFASSSEGEADFTGSFLTYAVKTILEQLAEHVGKEGGLLPGLGTVYSITAGLIEEIAEEDARAAAARGERAVATFLGSYRDRITSTFDGRVNGLPAMSDALILEYQRLAASQPGTATPRTPGGAPAGTQPGVAGDAAELLTGLKSYVEGLKPPTFDQCLQTIIESWVLQSEGKVESRGGGDIYIDGRILIRMDIDKDGESYTKRNKPKGSLQAPRADHVIDSLKIVFGKGKTTNDLAVLKVVTIRVEDEIDWGFNDWYDVVVKFRKRGEIEDVSTMGHPVHERRTHRNAPEVQRRVLQMVTFEELALTELTEAPRD
jgi:hypothetical protein